MKQKKGKGFTLIEMLLVIAIIGILAAAVLVSISGQREKAKKATVLKTLNGSVLPYLVECRMNGKNITNYVVGNSICSGSPINWPSMPLSEAGCGTTIAISNPNGTITASCGTTGAVGDIVCDFGDKGNCTEL